MQNNDSFALAAVATVVVVFLIVALVVISRKLLLHKPAQAGSSAASTQPSEEQGKIRSLRSVMLGDLTRLRGALVAAADSLRTTSTKLDDASFKQALDALHRFQLELETSPDGDSRGTVHNLAADRLRQLRMMDESIQSQLTALVDQELEVLSSFNGAKEGGWLSTEATDLTAKLEKVREGLRARHHSATAPQV